MSWHRGISCRCGGGCPVLFGLCLGFGPVSCLFFGVCLVDLIAVGR